MLLPSRGARMRVVFSMVLGAALCLALAATAGVASASSATAVKAVKTALGGNADAATRLAHQSGDAAAEKLVEWVNVTENWKSVGYARIMAFIADSPGWPNMELIHRRAEWLLFGGKPAPQQVLQHFASREPVSNEGRVALARALQAGGEGKRAARLIAETWSDPNLSSGLEKVLLSEFRQVLDRSVLEARVWRLIHAQQVTAALQAAKHISKDHVAAAQAAADLIREQKSGVDRYKKLPEALRNKQAMLYALARYHRRSGNTQAARDMLLKAPSNHAELIDPEAWWIERRIVVRESIGPKNRKHWPTAYKLATAHGYASGPHHSEGEFLAGWIALRMLDDPRTALKHFSTIADKAGNRTEASRGHYWTGRAWLALGERAKAEAAFAAAAKSPTLYYGQLAREALGLGRKAVPIAEGHPTDAIRAKVAKDELMRAFLLLADAGATSHLYQFLDPLAERFGTADEAAAVAALVDRKGGTFLSLRFAKAAGSAGADIDDWGYPRYALPSWKHRGHPVEMPMVLGLTRQESEFNPVAGSHAGARGLMQILPGTAKLIARQHKVGYSEGKLTSDPAYNVMLGAAHLGDLIAGYNGSYVLTLVAYNAGPRRVGEWIETYGDPRGEVDPIDWVESVPFTETRKYIQKVMQNVHVYRARLDPGSTLPMTADLVRGGKPVGRDLARGGIPASPTITATGDQDKDLSCDTASQASIVALIETC
jgi:soluble lytic murein transglycosylase